MGNYSDNEVSEQPRDIVSAQAPGAFSPVRRLGTGGQCAYSCIFLKNPARWTGYFLRQVGAIRIHEVLGERKRVFGAGAENNTRGARVLPGREYRRPLSELSALFPRVEQWWETGGQR